MASHICNYWSLISIITLYTEKYSFFDGHHGRSLSAAYISRELCQLELLPFYTTFERMISAQGFECSREVISSQMKTFL
jgi:hypothetical protein